MPTNVINFEFDPSTNSYHPYRKFRKEGIAGRDKILERKEILDFDPLTERFKTVLSVEEVVGMQKEEELIVKSQLDADGRVTRFYTEKIEQLRILIKDTKNFITETEVKLQYISDGLINPDKLSFPSKAELKEYQKKYNQYKTVTTASLNEFNKYWNRYGDIEEISSAKNWHKGVEFRDGYKLSELRDVAKRFINNIENRIRGHQSFIVFLSSDKEINAAFSENENKIIALEKTVGDKEETIKRLKQQIDDLSCENGITRESKTPIKTPRFDTVDNWYLDIKSNSREIEDELKIKGFLQFFFKHPENEYSIRDLKEEFNGKKENIYISQGMLYRYRDIAVRAGAIEEVTGKHKGQKWKLRKEFPV